MRRSAYIKDGSYSLQPSGVDGVGGEEGWWLGGAGGLIFHLIIEVLIEREQAVTLISARLEVWDLLVRLLVRGPIDRQRSASTCSSAPHWPLSFHR